MVYKIWRQAHMWLAAFCSVFLLLAATTGLILALSTARDHMHNPVPREALAQPLSEAVSKLSERYGELTSLEVGHGGVVVLEAWGADGEEVRLVVDPITGDSLGDPREPSEFIRWITSLHRSLFLHDLGRVFVGGFTCLFLLILLTGIVLLAKQMGLRKLLSPLGALPLSGRLHLEVGRWLFIPLLLVASTGSYLFMYRMGIIPQSTSSVEVFSSPQSSSGEILSLSEIPSLGEITLAEVRRLDFPLMDDEPYILQLANQRLSLSATSGAILEREIYPFAAIAQRISLDWHTGRTSLWYSIVLACTALATIVLLLSGFVMLGKRLRNRLRTKPQGDIQEADILLLVGSEHGSTWHIARYVMHLWQSQGVRVLLAGLGEYSSTYRARHLVVFSCTYGEGEPPSNAQGFEHLLNTDPVQTAMTYSVVAFGSKRYASYCAYGIAVDQWLGAQPNLTRLLPLYCVDNRSAHDLEEWVRGWNKTTVYPLPPASEHYEYKYIKSVL